MILLSMTISVINPFSVVEKHFALQSIWGNFMSKRTDIPVGLLSTEKVHSCMFRLTVQQRISQEKTVLLSISPPVEKSKMQISIKHAR